MWVPLRRKTIFSLRLRTTYQVVHRFQRFFDEAGARGHYGATELSFASDVNDTAAALPTLMPPFSRRSRPPTCIRPLRSP